MPAFFVEDVNHCKVCRVRDTVKLSCCVYVESAMEVKSHTCEVKIEPDNNDTTRHTREDKPRPYLCTMCHERFTTKLNLTRHRALHAGENWYSCTQCEKRFPSRSKLTVHMNIHTGKYKCTECGRCCVSSYELAVHRRSHTGQKPFECNVYNMRFTQSGSLFEHSRIHSGEKPFECTAVSYTHLTLPTILRV